MGIRGGGLLSLRRNRPSVSPADRKRRQKIASLGLTTKYLTTKYHNKQIKPVLFVFHHDMIGHFGGYGEGCKKLTILASNQPFLYYRETINALSTKSVMLIWARLIPATRWSSRQQSLLSAGGRLQLHLVAGMRSAQISITGNL